MAFLPHEASHECTWLKSTIQHIQQTCGLSYAKNKCNYPICIAQMKERSLFKVAIE